MYIVPFFNYINTVVNYDMIYKNNFLSFFQIPQIKLVYLSFNLNFLTLKYILYSLLFLNIITLQKPYLNIGKKIKINLLLKKNLFIGCKVVLRREKIYSFLNFLIIAGFPKITMKSLTKKSLNLNLLNSLVSFTFNLNSLSVQFREIEYYYTFFQYLNNLTITIQFSKELPKFQFLSYMYIPTRL